MERRTWLTRVEQPLCHKPRLSQLLEALRLDVTYHRSEGDHLYYRNEAGHEVEVLDHVGGYGSLILGHNHPELVLEATRLLREGRPVHAQGSRREYAERLARELSARAGGDFCAVFTNSGAEAVEAAVKHAMLETGGRTFVALEGAFHGKTLGALQLTAGAEHRDGFHLAGLNVLRVPRDGLDQLEAAFASASDLAGFIFEPIQGEGGAWPVAPAFAQRARALCDGRGIPLIADECQTGLGRTGEWLACEALRVRPDYLVLSKALGGGLAKIAAVLIHRSRYRAEFDLKHTSTYAEDDPSCALALKTLELTDQNVLDRCRETGARLLAGLKVLQEKYPRVVADVRGRGLLLGLEFHPVGPSDSLLLRLVSSQGYLAYLLASYLLHGHRVRVAPTLSNRHTLRLQPSAFLGDHDVHRILAAFEDVCLALDDQDAPRLTTHLQAASRFTTAAAPADDAELVARDEQQLQRYRRGGPPMRVAWLCHLVDPDDWTLLEPAFAKVPSEPREHLLGRLAAFASPVVLGVADLRSRLGAEVRLYSILLPVTSRWMKERIEARQTASARALVQKGIDAARSLGCGLIALGQYTSIVTGNGTSVRASGLGLTTGNSYTVALAARALERAHHKRGDRAGELILAVVGAGGNIGRTCAEILAPLYRRTVLVGSQRPGQRARLKSLAQRLPRTEVASEALVRTAQVVVAATNAVDPPLRPEHFAQGAIVCDISVPGSVCCSTAAARSDVLLIKGGTVRLPFGHDIGIAGFRLPAGYAYACTAEGIVLGFEGVRDTTFTGALTPERVRHIESLAERHGLELAEEECVLDRDAPEIVHASAR